MLDGLGRLDMFCSNRYFDYFVKCDRAVLGRVIFVGNQIIDKFEYGYVTRFYQ